LSVHNGGIDALKTFSEPFRPELISLQAGI
jgi:hypothetical protein